MAEKSGVPRVQRNRDAAGSGGGMRFDRARTRDYRRADRADAAAGDVVLPDAFGVLRRLGASGHSGGKTGPRASRGAGEPLPQTPRSPSYTFFLHSLSPTLLT